MPLKGPVLLVPLEPPETPDAPEPPEPTEATDGGLAGLDAEECAPVTDEVFPPLVDEPLLLLLDCANTEFVSNEDIVNAATIIITVIKFNFVMGV